MHFTNHLLALALLPILTPSLASAASPKARVRIWAEFFPSCPTNRIPPSSDNLPHEEFISALTISPGTCAPIYVPLLSGGGAEVTHLSFDAEVEVEVTATATGAEAQKCTIAIHEVPGCVDPPLLQEEVEHGFAASECVARHFVSYNQVWVRLDCKDEAKGEGEVQPSHRPLLHDRPYFHVNKTVELGSQNQNHTVANLTAPYANSTTSGTGIAARSGLLRRALRIRL